MIRLLAFALGLGPSLIYGQGAPVPRPIILAESYRLALERSEALAQSEEGVHEAEARVRELLAAVQPDLALKGTEFYQDEAPAPAGGAVSTFNRTHRPEYKLTGHQPLFSGFREYLAYQAAKRQTEAARLGLERARGLLYEDVATGYVVLLGVRQALEIRQSVRDLTRDRVRELREFRKIGRSRESEVLAAESQLAAAEADLETVAGQERGAQEVLRFLTGLDSDLAPGPLVLPGAVELKPYLDAARSRPDVEAGRREQEAAELSVTLQRRAHWPVLGLDANYYLKRVGFQKDIHWDASLTGSLPLYAGGATVARTRAAQSRKRAADAVLSLAQARADSEVRSAHQDLGSALRRAEALDKAAALAEKNARAQQEDYKNGLVTNLEVLGALAALQEARLKLDRARLDAALALARLEVAAGGPKLP